MQRLPGQVQKKSAVDHRSQADFSKQLASCNGKAVPLPRKSVIGASRFTFSCLRSDERSEEESKQEKVKLNTYSVKSNSQRMLHLRSGSGLHVGKCADGTLEAKRLRELARGVLPPFPGTRVVPVIIIPGPKLLSYGDDELYLVQNLAANYRDSIQVFYRRKSFFMMRGDPESHRSFSTLANFSVVLRLAEIPPAAWCLFSVSSWRDLDVSDRPPAVTWVFSAKRLETQRKWFEYERGCWVGRRERYSPAHLELIGKWKAMWRDLLCKRPPDRPSLLAIADRHFPGDAYRQAVERARGAAFRDQIAVDRHIEAGGNHWTA